MIGRSGGATEYTEDTENGTEKKFDFIYFWLFSVQSSVSSVFSVFSVAHFNVNAQSRAVVLTLPPEYRREGTEV